ncbi:TPA: MHYT domain-containing protein [Klebsiella variicola subsp. variicola]|nr:MHYT domain-containing protein [Klebsiella variicola]
MGTGVWAMHFVGMQAMVPVIGIRYNLLDWPHESPDSWYHLS